MTRTFSPEELAQHISHVVEWWIEPYLKPSARGGGSWLAMFRTESGEAQIEARFPTLRDLMNLTIMRGKPMIRVNWYIVVGTVEDGTEIYNIAIYVYGRNGEVYDTYVDDEAFLSWEAAEQAAADWFGL
ncbi:MAG: hypothetical protein WC505_06280 [Patescibacteria group bacterium]